ncbi:hypothetical protein GGQ97_001430 [Sphingomonas kaistensis]|uniref:DUF2975 domain-containing protein n=1 Tax=Sphingomonas kaistensis TaxID=298708 RepID=A0A7X5Y5R9_9SPHN|nr:hypothetical protein [Sphingomonas kaistensis]NJC05637.1 hypothetical protein [Sphingomonas kaistensis]
MTYRTRISPRDTTLDLSTPTLRMLTIFALVAYPVGAILKLAPGPTGGITDFVGGLLRVAALAAMITVASSTLARIVVGGRREKLDEFQAGLRLSAMSKAYTALSALVCAATVYAYLATDLRLPMPASAEAWQQLCIGIMLAILILPATFLVWSPAIGVDERDEEEG